jgi:hypothetical protein
MQAEPFDEAALFRAIAGSGARALLIGRRALVALGIPVGTLDYDFWLHAGDVALFNGALEPLGFVPSQTAEGARRRGRYVLEDSERVDVLIARSMPTVTGERVAFDDVWGRRQLLPYDDGVAIALPAIDDLIATKRFGSRPKDLDDIELLEAFKRSAR